MNCQSFENCVTDLARHQPFEATALHQALAHAESCAACALKLEDQRALTLGLGGLAAEMKTVQIPDGLEGRLVEVFREQVHPPQGAHTTTRRWFAVAAVAAVLLVAFGIIGLRLRSAPPLSITSEKSLETETPPQVAPEVLPTSTPVLSTNQENSVLPGNRPSRRIVAKHRPKRAKDSSLTAVNENAVPTEITTEFMPLGDVSVAYLQEDTQVVRVEMPRYAMARFGLPVNMERYDERVKADLWVGVDGLARAIRFVQ